MSFYLSTNPEELAKLKKKLTIGEIIYADIKKKIDNKKYIVSIKGSEIYAESYFNILSEKVLVQIEALNPQIHLRFIPGDRNIYLERIIQISKKYSIILDELNYFILLKMLQYNKSIPADISAILEQLSHVDTAISPDEYINLDDIIFALDQRMNYLSILLNVLLHKNISIISDSDSMNSCTEPVIISGYTKEKTEHHTATRENINTNFNSFFDTICEVIPFLNEKLITRKKTLEGWFIPQEKHISFYLVQKILPEKNNQLGKTIVPLKSETLGTMLMEIAYLQNDLSFCFFTENSISNAEVKDIKTEIGKITGRFGLNLLNYTTSYLTHQKSIPEYLNQQKVFADGFLNIKI